MNTIYWHSNRFAAAPESSGTATKQTGTISNTGSSTATSVGQVSSTPSSGGATSGSASKKSNAGAIAGGVVGGLVLLGLIAGLIAFFVIRSRRAKNAPSTEYSAYGNGQNGPPNSPPLMSQHSYNQNPHDVNQPQQLYVSFINLFNTYISDDAYPEPRRSDNLAIAGWCRHTNNSHNEFWPLATSIQPAAWSLQRRP